MPGVRKDTQVVQGGYHTRSQIDKLARPAKARDDLGSAFAGNENQGPAAKKKTSVTRGTHYKSRKTGASRQKSPKR